MKIIYAIRDRIANDLAGTFPLVVMRTDGQAVRYFSDSLATPNSALGAHPQDYELIKLGTVNDDGTILAQKPEVIITGTALTATQEHTTEQTKLQLEQQRG